MMCHRCSGYLTKRQDDGTGAHVECPTSDRNAYLVERRRRMPNLDAIHDRIRERGELTADDHEQLHAERK